MRLQNFILSFLILLSCSLFSQAPVIAWQKSIGGTGVDFPWDMFQTTDGGYIIGAISNSDISGDKTENCRGMYDYWIIKTDSLANIQWQKTIGGSGEDNLKSIQNTTDGGYIICGYSKSVASGEKSENNMGLYYTADYWMVKLDSVGNLEWENTIGGENNDWGEYAEQSDDGGYVVFGYSESEISGDKTEIIGGNDIWMVKLNSEGMIVWDKAIGTTRDEQNVSVVKCATGYLITCTGEYETDDYLSVDYFVLKIDNAGNTLWEKHIGGEDSDSPEDVILTEPDGFIISGNSFSNSCPDKSEDNIGWGDYWIVKMDTFGNIEWENTIGGNGFDNWSFIDLCSDNSYIIAGISSSDSSGDKSEDHLGASDYWVLKLDPDGSILWQSTIGTNVSEGLNNIFQTFDGGYMCPGATTGGISEDKTSPNIGLTDIWLVKLFPDCNYQIYFADTDNDFYGDSVNHIYSCYDSTGYVLNNTDCDDTNPFINPGLAEICNNIDDNCTATIDEDLIFSFYFNDNDGDDFGDAEVDTLWCALPVGFVLDSTDCNDTNPLIYPGAEEIINGLDDNCNELIDEVVTLNITDLISIIIYPNPVKIYLNIEFNTSAPPFVEVVNTTGGVTARYTCLFPTTKIDVANYAPGIYFLRLNDDNKYYWIKFIKE